MCGGGGGGERGEEVNFAPKHIRAIEHEYTDDDGREKGGGERG